MTSMVQADLGPSSSVVKYKDDPIGDPVSLFLFFLSWSRLSIRVSQSRTPVDGDTDRVFIMLPLSP